MFETSNLENSPSSPPDIDDNDIDNDADDNDETTITQKSFPFPFLICFLRFFFF